MATATKEKPATIAAELDELMTGLGPAPELNVPIVDSSEVQRLMAELASERDARTKAEAQVQHTLGIQRGMPSPQLADSYVPRDEVHLGLNETNAEDTIALAEERGKPNFKSSHVSHRLGNNKTKGRGTTFWLYDKQGMARRVPGQSLSSALAFGLYPICPLCEGYHDRPDRETNPNACPTRAAHKAARTYCSICRNNSGSSVYIYDTQEAFTGTKQDEDDETMVVMDLPSTPHARLKVKLDAHIRTFHPETAKSMGLAES